MRVRRGSCPREHYFNGVLRKMRDLKLLKYRNDGRMAYYSLRSEGWLLNCVVH